MISSSFQSLRFSLRFIVTVDAILSFCNVSYLLQCFSVCQFLPYFHDRFGKTEANIFVNMNHLFLQFISRNWGPIELQAYFRWLMWKLTGKDTNQWWLALLNLSIHYLKNLQLKNCYVTKFFWKFWPDFIWFAVFNTYGID